MTDSRLTKRPAWSWLGAGLIALVAGLTARYGLFIGQIGEWEFDTFGRYYPGLTGAAIVAIAVLPVLAIVWWRNRRRRRREEAGVPDQAGLEQLALARWRRRGRMFERLFAVLAAVFAMGELAILASLYTLPGVDGLPRLIDRNDAGVVDGPAYFSTGSVGRVSRLDDNFLWGRRTLFVAPVLFPGHEADAVHFMTTVEVRNNRFVPISTGIIVRQGLPPELRHLYRSIGVAVSDTASLMMKDENDVTWRTREFALFVAVLTLSAAVVWLFLRQQRRRIDAMFASDGPNFV